MKKTLVLGASILLLAGCGNTVKCTTKDKDRDISYTVSGEFNKKDELQSYTQTVKYSDKKDAKQSCKSAKAVYGDDKNAKIKCSGKEVSVTVKRPKNAKQEVTKKEFTKAYKSDGMTCK